MGLVGCYTFQIDKRNEFESMDKNNFTMFIVYNNYSD